MLLIALVLLPTLLTTFFTNLHFNGGGGVCLSSNYSGEQPPHLQARRRRGELKIPWPYDHHEDASPPSMGVVAHVSELSSEHEVVRLRLPVRVGLADDKTRGDFITALHSFYLKTKDEYPVRMTPAC